MRAYSSAPSWAYSLLFFALAALVPAAAEEVRAPHLEKDAVAEVSKGPPSQPPAFTIPVALETQRKTELSLRKLKLDPVPAQKLAKELEKMKTPDGKEVREIVDLVGELYPTRFSETQRAEVKRLFLELEKDAPKDAPPVFVSALRLAAPDEDARKQAVDPAREAVAKNPGANPFATENGQVPNVVGPGGAPGPDIQKLLAEHSKELSSLLGSQIQQAQKLFEGAKAQAKGRDAGNKSLFDELAASIGKGQKGGDKGEKGSREDRDDADGRRGPGPGALAGLSKRDDRASSRDRDRDRERERDRDRDRDSKRDRRDERRGAKGPPPGGGGEGGGGGAKGESKGESKKNEGGGSERSASAPAKKLFEEATEPDKSKNDLSALEKLFSPDKKDNDEELPTPELPPPTKSGPGPSEALNPLPPNIGGGGGFGGGDPNAGAGNAPSAGAPTVNGPSGGGGGSDGGGDMFSSIGVDYGSGPPAERFNFEKPVAFGSANNGGGGEIGGLPGPEAVVDGGPALADPASRSKLGLTERGQPLFLTTASAPKSGWILDNVTQMKKRVCGDETLRKLVALCPKADQVAKRRATERRVTGGGGSPIDALENLVAPASAVPLSREATM